MYGIPITPIGHAAHAVFPLLLIAALFRVFGRGGDPNAPWNTKIDAGLAVLSGVVGTAMSTGWMARYFVTRRPITASDFGQYCESLGAFRADQIDAWSMQRSLVAGFVPGLLADAFGIVDALLVGATMSHCLMLVGIFLWARAAHSRLAGLVAVAMACSAAPLVHLSRTVTFYPETVAGCVLSAAGAVMAMRYRKLPAFVFAALAIGLTLLLDVRGLLWALPALGITVVAVLLAPGLHRKVLGLLVVGGCLYGSHSIGAKTTWEQSPSLEQQTVYYVDEAIRRYLPNDPEAGLEKEKDFAGSRFVWGRSGATTVHKTLGFLLELRSAVPDGIENQQETAYSRRVHLMPWVVPGAVGLLLAVVGAWRRKWLVAAVLGSMVPFAVALQGTAQMVGHSRYLANGITMVPVLMGVGFAALYWGSLSDSDEDALRPALTRSDGLAVGLVLVMVLGMIPSWVSPVANWRAPVSADIEPANTIWHAAHSDPLPLDVARGCADALKEDYANGLPVGSALMEWTVEESPTHDPTLEGE
jgi:hypothetical protein